MKTAELRVARPGAADTVAITLRLIGASHNLDALVKFWSPKSRSLSAEVKGPRKAVLGYKIAPNRFKTTYRSVP